MDDARLPPPVQFVILWLPAVTVALGAWAHPVAWYSVFAAGILLVASRTGGAFGNACAACASAAVAPVSSLGWSLGFALSVLVSLRARRGAQLEPATRMALALALGAGLAVGAKQILAANALLASDKVAGTAVAAGLGVAAAIAWALSAGGEKSVVGGVVLAGVPTALALGLAATGSGPATLDNAAAVDATALLYPKLLDASRKNEQMLVSLVAISPMRDEAADNLAVADALDAGWYPANAGDRVVEVARALWDRGRGGEAMRLLRRHPRRGEVDGVLALFERLSGERSGWKGGVVGYVLPGIAAVGAAGAMDRDGSREFLFTATKALNHAAVVIRADSFQGAPLATLEVDGRVRQTVSVPAEQSFELGYLDAGAHLLRVTYLNDRFGPDGDRNLVVESLGATE